VQDTFEGQMNSMVRRQVFLMIVALFSSLIVFARTGGIKGKVVDKDGKPLAGVNIVALVDSNKQLARAELSNDLGDYEISSLPDGEYVLKANLVGYQPYSSEKLRVSGGDMNAPVITLLEKDNTMKEVSVQAMRPLIEVKADMLVVNVENSIVNAGSSALEVLSRSPGVRVDQNDNISLRGKQGVMVWIDGKRSPLSGSDLADVLKSMPANAIEKIELISNPGAKYDAAGMAGIINIRTKKDKRMGMNGSVNGSYAQGIYPKYNAGTNINYRNKKLTLNASYNYSHRNGFNHLMLYRQFYNGKDRLYAYDQNNFTRFPFRNHLAAIGADYALSKKTTVGVSVNGSNNSYKTSANNYTNTEGSESSVRLYDFRTVGGNNVAWNNYATTGFLRHTFDSTGKELSVDLDYAHYWSTSEQNFTTTYADYDNDAGNDIPDYIQQTNLRGETKIRSLKADYTNPLKGQARFDVGIKSTYVTADRDPKYYDLSSGSAVLDTTRTNHFKYYENINAAYLNFNKEWTKWSMQLGLRMENTNVTADQLTLKKTFDTSYTQLYPSFAFQYHLHKDHDLGITLSRRIERPSYEQLNPFKFFIDKTTYKEGYPYLFPASSYSVELSHVFKQRFVTTFTYSLAMNHIVEVIQPSDVEDSVTVQTNKNIKQMRFIGINGAYNTQVTKWWTNVTNLNIYHAQYVGNIANTPLDKGGFTYDINTSNSFMLPKDFSAELSLFYQAKQVYAYMVVNPVWMLNLGLQKNFFDKKLTVRLNATDIFWRGYPSATSIYSNYREDFIAERDTRQFSVSLTYRFGKKTVAPVKRRAGGAEEEKNRAGNGGA
jgi:hypothetical protein